MTGWHLRGGYSAVALGTRVDAALDEIVAETRRDGKGLKRDVVQVEGFTTHLGHEVNAVVEHYRDCTDATLTRHVRKDDGRVEWVVLASGGGMSRSAKETAARAFVRGVIRRMHGRGLDVTVVVA